MDVTERDIEQIPPGNIRVPRKEFAEVWRRSEKLLGLPPSAGGHWSGGVALTCEWLAAALVPPPGGGPTALARGPVTGRVGASQESIQFEAMAAEKALVAVGEARSRGRDVLEGIVATFEWAWWRIGPSPLAWAQTSDERG